MKKNILTRAAAAAMAAAFTLTAAVPAYAESAYYTDTAGDHSDVNFEDMDISDFDVTEVNEAIDALNAAAAKENNEEEVRTCYEKMLEEVDRLATVSNIVDIHYYDDVNDEERAGLSDEYTMDLTVVGDAADQALSNMMNSDYAYIMREDIGEQADDFLNYEPLTDEEIVLSDQELELTQQYEALSVSEYDDEETWYEQQAQIYIDLVNLRKRQAELYGYDSYEAYCYEEVFGRDYSVEEAEQYREYIKDNMTAVMGQLALVLAITPGINKLYTLEGPDSDTILEKINAHLSDISPELQEAFDYMIDHHLYDIDYSDSKMSMGYTTRLYSYNALFIYNEPYQNFFDYTDMIHEFGHFNNMYHNPKHALYDKCCYDLAEILSQGLELLYLEYADDFYGEKYAKADRYYELYSMANVVLDGCMYDEFQQKAFEADDLTVESLTQLFIDVSSNYGYTEENAHDWVQVSHNFQNPFYYISYSTSAMAALEIYTDSLDDRAGAIDTYLKLSAVDTSTGLQEALADAGLGNVLEEENIKKVADSIETEVVGPVFMKIAVIALAVMLVLIGLTVFIIMMIVRKVQRSRKRKLKKQMEKAPL